MREMGTVPLLNRSEEIDIAKRIEEGTHMVQSSVAGYPQAISYLLNLYDESLKGNLRLGEIVAGFTDENGEKLVNPKASYWFDENNQYTIDVMTQEQLDQIMALYSSTELVSQNDEEVMNIIKGETEAYFAGSKTLDDTVRLIQNRVSLYVAEQK